MKLARFRKDGGPPAIGCVLQERVVDLTELVPLLARRLGMPAPSEASSVCAWIEAGWLAPHVALAIERLAGELRLGMACPALDEVDVLPPVDRPRQVLAVGRNFVSHAREGGHEAPEEPIIFAKAVSSLIGHEHEVRCPESVGRVDHEAEVAVIVGRGGRNIPAERAREFIAGYTCFNDLTARDLQRQDAGRGHPWLRSKGMDTFGPIGPWLVTADEMPWPLAGRIECRVNGDLRQQGDAKDMLFPPDRIIAFISRYITLSPGDVIALGTPEGVGPLAPGDVVEVFVEGVGLLRNPVARAEG